MTRRLLEAAAGLLLMWIGQSVNAGQTTYNFNFSGGGTGSLVYDDVSQRANPITMDFGSFGAITTDFDNSSTFSIFGTPPQEATKLDGVFFPLRRTGETSNYAGVRLYTNRSFCVQVLPEQYPTVCALTGTYRIAPALPPTAYSGTYSFNFSDHGSGYFKYDGASGTISTLHYDFGALGDNTTSFDSFLTALVFGNPPSVSVIQNNTFFNLSGGTAYGLRLQTNGQFCVRPDADFCGGTQPDLATGTYTISLIPPGTTATGSNVVAVPTTTNENGDPVESGVVMTFDEVTETGSVTVRVLESASSEVPALPNGFALAGSTTFFDITTTSTFTGEVRVCIGYTDSTLANESLLRLYHYHEGTWIDITAAGSPDTVNNVICGNTDSFSIFAPVLPPEDSDGDGLTDDEESAIGTNPHDPDSDDDGLEDGTEVKVNHTAPLLADSDGDGLTDGSEVSNGTDPLKWDSDEDGVSDSTDPTPLTPGVTSGFLEDELRKLGADVLEMDLALMDARNEMARKGRRTAMSNQLSSAANFIADGNLEEAVSVLTSLLGKIDDEEKPADWMISGEDKTRLRNNVLLMMGLIRIQ